MRYLPHHLITILLVLVLAACTNSNSETSLPAEIKVESKTSTKEITVFQDASKVVIDSDPVVEVTRVGLIIDEENLMASYDRQPGVAFVGAIEELNRNGGLLGKPIELLRINSESRLSVIDTAAEKLIEAGVQLLVVTCELDFATPAIQRAKEAEVLVISPCASEEEWGSGEVDNLAFSMTTRPAAYGAELANYLWEQEYRSVAIFWDDTSPETIQECLAFRDSWRNLGGWSTVESAINMVTAPSVIGPADRNKTLDVDVIITCATQRVGILTLELIRGAGWLTPIIAGPSLDSASFFPSDVSGLGDFRMVSFASTEGDDPYPAVNKATEYFKNIDGISPASGRFILGADLADLWKQAVELAGTADSRLVAQTIKSFESIEVPSGTIEFEGTQAVTKRALRMLRHSEGVMIFDTLMR